MRGGAFGQVTRMAHDRERRDFARRLRQQMNAVESALWDRLCDRRHGRFKFRRQHALGPYVADFWCPVARLVVELDGLSHRERVEEDKARDEWLDGRNIQVLRFMNSEVETNIESVLKKILEVCEVRMK